MKTTAASMVMPLSDCLGDWSTVRCTPSGELGNLPVTVSLSPYFWKKLRDEQLVVVRTSSCRSIDVAVCASLQQIQNAGSGYVFLFSLAYQPETIGRRFLSIRTGIDRNRMRRLELCAEEIALIATARSELASAPVLLAHCYDGLEVSALCSRALPMYEPCSLIIVDGGPEGTTGPSMLASEEQLLVELGSTHGCPILAVTDFAPN